MKLKSIQPKASAERVVKVASPQISRQIFFGWNLSFERSSGRLQAREPCISWK